MSKLDGTHIDGPDMLDLDGSGSTGHLCIVERGDFGGTETATREQLRKLFADTDDEEGQDD